MSKLKSLHVLTAVALVATGVSHAEQGASAAAPVAASAKGALVFSAPPREKAEEGIRTYQPIADYLSKVLGKPVVYKYPRTWGAYRTEMLMGKYDIVFDGPHFVDYRVQKLNHNVVAKLNEDRRAFAIVVPRDEKVAAVPELGGRTVCTQSPPNLGALILLSQANQTRKPVMVPEKSWEGIYDGVTAGRCVGGVLPVHTLKALDRNGLVKTVYESDGMPDQAITAGPRLSPEEQAKIAAALVAPEASAPTEKLRTRFKGGEGLLAGSNAEYAGFGDLLRQEWGFF